MSEHRPERKHSPSFVWPIILILVGGIFLLSNLGLFEDNVWESIWRLWPLIFIAIGLDGLFRRNEIAGPVFMIGLGSVFLLGSVGMLGWGAWDILWRLWPLLLVAFGLEIIIGRRSLWLSLLTVVVIVAILVGVLWMSGIGPASGERIAGDTVNQPLGSINHAEISISPAAGDLVVYGLTDSNALIHGQVSTASNRQVYTDYNVSGDTGHFSIDSRALANFPGTRPWDWDLGLTNQIPMELNIAMGAGGMAVDLSGLILETLDVSQAVGELKVSLTGMGDYSADISQAVGSIVIDLPEDVGVRLEVSRAISSLDLPSSYERRGDYYYSPGYDNADYQIDLQISQAVGSIVVR
jgi:hypothetical protein